MVNLRQLVLIAWWSVHLSIRSEGCIIWTGNSTVHDERTTTSTSRHM